MPDMLDMPDILKNIRLLALARQGLALLTRKQAAAKQAEVDAWIKGPAIACATPWTEAPAEPAPEIEEYPWLIEFLAVRAQYWAQRRARRLAAQR